VKTEKLKSKKDICSEVSVNSPRGIRGVSSEEEKGGYGGNDLQGFKPGMKVRWVLDDDSGESMES